MAEEAHWWAKMFTAKGAIAFFPIASTNSPKLENHTLHRWRPHTLPMGRYAWNRGY